MKRRTEYLTLKDFLDTLRRGSGAPDECGVPAKWEATDASIPVAHPPCSFKSKKEAAGLWRTNKHIYKKEG